MPDAADSRELSRVDTFLANHTDFLAHADTTIPANTECPICLEDVSEHICVKIVGIPGCVHMIGLECLQVLLNNHPNDKKLCPLCRTEWLDGPGPGPEAGYSSEFDEPYDLESDYDNRYRPDIRYGGGHGPNILETGYANHWTFYDDTEDLAQPAGARQLPVQQNQQRPSYLGPRMSEYFSMNDSRRTTRTLHVPLSQRVPGYTYNGGPARYGSRTNQQADTLQQAGGNLSTNSTQRSPGLHVEATSRYGQPLADVPWTTPPFGRRHQYGSTTPQQRPGAASSVQPTRHQHGTTAPQQRTGAPRLAPFTRHQQVSTAAQPRTEAPTPSAQPVRRQHGNTAPPARTGVRPVPAQAPRHQHGSTAPPARTGAPTPSNQLSRRQHRSTAPPPRPVAPSRAHPSRRQHTPSQPAPTRPATPNQARIQQTHTTSRTLTSHGQNSSIQPVNVTPTHTAGQVRFTRGQNSSVQPVRVTTTRTGGPHPSIRHEVSVTSVAVTAGSAQQARGEVGVSGIVVTRPSSGR